MQPLDASHELPARRQPVAASTTATSSEHVVVRRLSSVAALGDAREELRLALADGPPAGPGTALVPYLGQPLVALSSGLASKIVIGPDGRRRIVRIYVPGDIVNLPQFLTKSPDARIVALSDCRLAFLPANKTAAMMETWPVLHRALMREAGIEIAALQKWLEPRSPSASIAHLYCELHARHQRVGLARPAGVLDLVITQTQVAEAVGASLVHPNKSASVLRKQGWVAFNAGTHRILDVTALAEHAQFDPSYLEP